MIASPADHRIQVSGSHRLTLAWKAVCLSINRGMNWIARYTGKTPVINYRLNLCMCLAYNSASVPVVQSSVAAGLYEYMSACVWYERRVLVCSYKQAHQTATDSLYEYVVGQSAAVCANTHRCRSRCPENKYLNAAVFERRWSTTLFRATEKATILRQKRSARQWDT